MRTGRSSVSPSRLGLVAGVLLCARAACALADGTETAGDVLAIALPATAFAFTFTHDDPAGRVQFYKSFGVTVAETWLLKQTVHKERPDGSNDQSFPSGHASAAFQAASFVQRRYDDLPAWPGYLLATYTGWTRVEAKKHFTSDVLAGAALGLSSSFVFVTRRHVHVSTALEHHGFEIRFAGNSG
jgi:membrane-associated phospholipid phosphatase